MGVGDATVSSIRALVGVGSPVSRGVSRTILRVRGAEWGLPPVVSGLDILLSYCRSIRIERMLLIYCVL